ncbi:MAG: trigger factor [Actinomycetes bacterium]
METQLEQLPGDRVRLTVEVPAHDVHHAVEHATSDLSERVKVPGFRPGKVPTQVLLAKIGKERLYAEAVESHIDSWFWSGVRRHRLRPTEQPSYDYELPADPDSNWSFTAEVPVQALPEVADWSKLEAPRLEVEVPEDFIDKQVEQLQRAVADLSAVDGRPAKMGDVAVVDIVSETGLGQRDYVVELGTERLVDEIERAIRDLLPGDSQEVSWELQDGTRRGALVKLKDLHEKVLPALDDDFARSASEFDTVAELRADLDRRMREQLEAEADSQFRAAAIDELVKASNVKPAALVVEMRTRELINSFLRQLESRGIDPRTYLQMTGITGADLEKRLYVEAAQSIARELVLEATVEKLKLVVSDDDIRAELKAEGETDEDIDEFMEAGGADRVRPDLSMKRAMDRIAAEVTPISQELANTRDSIWTPDKDKEPPAAETKIWTPGS